MTRETRLEILAHALRWASNMAVEAMGNHGSAIEDNSNRTSVREATLAMQRAVDAVTTELLRAQKS